MLTSISESTKIVRAISARFQSDSLYIRLSDGREIGIQLHRYKWLQWLANAPDAQKMNWEIEPGGYAIYWPELDDGIEIEHLLSLHELP